jgi:hypothetical protein
LQVATLRELLAELDPDEFWQVHRASGIRVSAIKRVVKTDAGHMRVRLRGASEEVAVSAAFMARFRQMGTSQNLLRGQISRLRRICVNQCFTRGKCKGPAPRRELCPLATVFRRSQM